MKQLFQLAVIFGVLIVASLTASAGGKWKNGTFKAGGPKARAHSIARRLVNR